MHGKMFRLRLRRYRQPRPRRAAPIAALTLVAALALVAAAGHAEATTAGHAEATAAGHAEATAAGRPATITINGAVQYQRIAGFGASEAFGQAETSAV